MRAGHLFNGISGFGLAAHWMGWSNVMHCEIDSFCNRVMNYHFPNSYQHENIRTTDFTFWRGKIDLITGGFPCQPYSTAGKRKGTADERHLWPEMLRAIREISPRWIVAENVRGLTNWNGGMVFDQVQADMEAEGYEVIPFLLPAAGVGAPHRRDRIWFIAHAADNTRNDEPGNEGQEPYPVQEKRSDEFIASADTTGERYKGWQARSELESFGSAWHVANALGIGQQGPGWAFNPGSTEKDRNWKASWAYDDGRWPTESPVRGIYDGVSELLDTHIKPEIYASINKRYSREDLQEMREILQSQEIRQKIGGLYKIHESGILLKVLQLCSTTDKNEKRISVYSEETSEKILRKMQKYGTLANSPQGRKLEKQFQKQFNNSLPFLSHEIALVAMETERAAMRFNLWWIEQSLTALGNAIVPQIAFELFKAIEQYDLARQGAG